MWKVRFLQRQRSQVRILSGVRRDVAGSGGVVPKISDNRPDGGPPVTRWDGVLLALEVTPGGFVSNLGFVEAVRPRTPKTEKLLKQEVTAPHRLQPDD